MTSTLVVGDVHGCAEELHALLCLTDATRVVLVGDLFCKGPDPAAVLRLVRSRDMDAVLGNHDARLLEWLSGARDGDEEAERCVAALDGVDLDWRTWLATVPLMRTVDGYTVVHAGLHPSGARERTTRAMALYMRSWPPDQPDAPRWHEQYTGKRGVIFGHDARRGLVCVERGGAPFLVGLDTGCVYGGRLTGFLVDEQRLVSVPAARVYSAVS